MCGFWAAVTRGDSPILPSESVLERLSARGPDGIQTVTLRVTDDRDRADGTNGSVWITITAAILALRGPEVVKQPLVHPPFDLTSSHGIHVEQDRFIFCWNGEAWKYDQEKLGDNVNDTELIFTSLRNAVLNTAPLAGNRDPVSLIQLTQAAISADLERIQGPYSFILYDPTSKSLVFGRDCLGRRSLLIQQNQDGFVVSSVSPADPDSKTGSLQEWAEIDADGFYISPLFDHSFPVPKNISSFTSGDQIFPTSSVSESCTDDGSDGLSMFSRFGCFNDTFLHVSSPLTTIAQPVIELEGLLRASVDLRLPIRRPIDQTLHPALSASLDDPKRQSQLAVLFSGGLDCTVLARLCHDTYPLTESIDLINVAFENPRLVRNSKTLHPTDSALNTDPYSLCPDRSTALQAYAELRSTCPGRIWKLVEVNVPYTVYTQHRPTIISLIRPHKTEMDLSIAAALYFASRGVGSVREDLDSQASDHESPKERPYTSHATVLYSGLGADELFGGYQRHETAFSRGGYPALVKELHLDFSRLGKRNLGRDDRVTAHWGREVRYPFLDEAVVTWALGKSVLEKCPFGDVSYPCIVSEQQHSIEGHMSNTMDTSHFTIEPAKRILRLIAYRLGLVVTAREKKRAIQFGARTAKMAITAGKTKGVAVVS